MDIKITPQMEAEIVKQVSASLINEMRTRGSYHQLADTIRSQIVGQLSQQIAGEFHKKLNTSQMINNALKSAEDKFNARIEKTLRQGVSLRIQLGEKEEG